MSTGDGVVCVEGKRVFVAGKYGLCRAATAGVRGIRPLCLEISVGFGDGPWNQSDTRR